MVPLIGCILSEPLSYISCLFKVSSSLSEEAIQIYHMEPANTVPLAVEGGEEPLRSDSTWSHAPLWTSVQAYTEQNTQRLEVNDPATHTHTHRCTYISYYA